MSIQLFVPKFRVDECLNEVKECLEKGWTGLGYKTVEIEEEWKKYTGLEHAHFISSATAGLHLALYVLRKRYGWSDGDEVISTSLTFVSTNHAIKYCNLMPVFADVDDHLCLDPIDVEKKIGANTRAIIFVGIAGNTGQFNKIVELCRKHNLKLVLDAAHMAGTRLEGKHVGPGADATVFSFQSVKNLPTADSGMICFAEREDDEVVRKLTWLGINKDTFSRTVGKGAYKWKYDVEDIGFKYHGNSIMASLALVGLKYLDNDNAYRRQLASWYRHGLASVSGVDLIPIAPDCESSTHLFQILVEERDRVIMALNDHEIYPGVHYTDNTVYEMYSYDGCENSRSRSFSDKLLSLPMHLGVTKKDVDSIVEVVGMYGNK
ncbi:aminotransferase DegT [Halioglobus sp. HI00S01]|uniref:DegT/DnrJ/EryC1/StrS family aminotransferase n=1 Tax=Halioglobus sp. HI00S01 TaxID=1822214 RepID=UPI0007C28D03|nr:DegT/DnrJ/EryC1/StrS family aminotransferase [Halioglobus sp. HI00S01]KZX51248.1 aminotransferase DegT [Halioglobus sp. HI00S01]